MKHLEKLTRKRLGEILIDEGLITKAQLADAEREQKRTGETLGSILVEASYIHEQDLAKIVAVQYQLPYVRLAIFPKSKEMAELFPVAQMKKLRFVPLDRIGGIMTFAVAEMPDIGFLHSLQDQHEVLPFLFVTEMSDIMERLEGKGMKRPTAPPEPAKPTGVAAAAAAAIAPPPPKPELDPSDGISMETLEGLEAMDRILPDESGIPRSPAGEGASPGSDDSDGSWENIFDVANESILNEIDND